MRAATPQTERPLSICISRQQLALLKKLDYPGSEGMLASATLIEGEDYELTGRRMTRARGMRVMHSTALRCPMRAALNCRCAAGSVHPTATGRTLTGDRSGRLRLNVGRDGSDRHSGGGDPLLVSSGERETDRCGATLHQNCCGGGQSSAEEPPDRHSVGVAAPSAPECAREPKMSVPRATSLPSMRRRA